MTNIKKLSKIIEASVFYYSPSYEVNLGLNTLFKPDKGILLYNQKSSLLMENGSSLEQVLKQMTPEFQRKNTKWNKDMQISFVQNVICGFDSKILLYYTKKNSMNNCLILDGLQRLTALAAFIEGEFKVFGEYEFIDLPLNVIRSIRKLILRIYEFETDKEACEFYIAMNKNITHNEQDLKTAYDFLENKKNTK